MFRSRSKFRNEAPASWRGFRVGLVLTVVLAMVAVLASTVGVISSQTSTPPTLTVGSATYSAVEGESFTVTLTSSSSQDYALVLDTIAPTDSDFEFENDVSGLILSPNVGKQVIITKLPQIVMIESRTTMITLWFRGANDISDESDEMFTLSAKPGTGTAATTAITLTDPPQLEATFSVTSPITEGDRAQITINLNTPLTRAHAQSARTGEDGYSQVESSSSGFEDISSIPGAAFPVDVQNGSYLRNLGFDFWFYGKRYSHIAVHTNGFIGFTNDTANVEIEVNTADPNIAPGNVGSGGDTPGANGFILPGVSPLLSPINYQNPDNLDPAPAFYGALLGAGTPQERYIVQYTNARVGIGGGNRAPATFQVVLWLSGRIWFSYDNVPVTAQNVAKIGISNGDGRVMYEMYEEYSYETDRLDTSGTKRIIYNPQDSLVNVVIEDSDGTRFWTRALRTDFSVGTQSMSIMSTIHLDTNRWDGNQVYTVSLETDARSAHLFTANAAVTYTVNDNDAPKVTLERVSGSGPIEEGTSVELRARLTNAPDGAPEDLVVNLARDITSTADTIDYDTIPDSVTIATGATQRVFTVSIKQDTLVELDELLQLRVSRLDYGTTMLTPTMPMPSIDLMIRSDDMITAEITAANTRENGTVDVTIKLGQVLLSGVAPSALMLVLDGTDRTADIVSGLPADITQALKNGRETTVQVVLNDDNRLEGDEVVNLRLAYTTSDIPFLPATSGSFTIIDNEVGGMVEIAQVGNTSPEEGGTVQFEFMLDLAAGVTTDIPVMVRFDITAPPGVPYEVPTQPGVVTVSAPGLGTGFAQGLALPVRGLAQMARTYIITIPAGMASAVLTVQLTDDTADPTAEETEELTVSLVSVSTSSAEPLIQRNPSKMRAKVEVLDNEPVEFEIIGNGEVNEDDGTYQVQLRRLGKISDNEIVFEIAGDGADEGDFVGPLTGMKFVFSGNNALSEKILLPLDDDDSEESEKTFQIRVYAPGTGAQLQPQIFTSVDPNNRMSFTSITLLDSDVAAFSGLPATGGLALPIWLVLLLALTGVALLVPALRRM